MAAQRRVQGVVPIVGGLQRFVNYVSNVRDDLSISSGGLSKLLNGTLKSHQQLKETFGKLQWRAFFPSVDEARSLLEKNNSGNDANAPEGATASRPAAAAHSPCVGGVFAQCNSCLCCETCEPPSSTTIAPGLQSVPTRAPAEASDDAMISELLEQSRHGEKALAREYRRQIDDLQVRSVVDSLIHTVELERLKEAHQVELQGREV